MYVVSVSENYGDYGHIETTVLSKDKLEGLSFKYKH